MDLNFTESKNYDIASFEGDITISTLTSVTSALTKNIDKNRHKNLVINSQEISFIDSSGLRMLINLKKKKEAHNKKLYLLAPSGPLLKLLQDTNLLKTMDTIDSIEELEKIAVSSLIETYKEFTTEENGLLRLSLSCPICGSNEIAGYLIDLNEYEWFWEEGSFFPGCSKKGSSQTFDAVGHLPIVCMECYMASINLADFNACDGNNLSIKSKVNDHFKSLMAKSINKRKKMIETDNIIGNNFFDAPRDKMSCYQSFKLAEFCIRSASMNKENFNPYVVGFLNYSSLQYAPAEEKNEMINNCRTWTTQVLNNSAKFSETEIAISHFILLATDISLEKYDEGTKAYNIIKEKIKDFSSGNRENSFFNPSFWYTQAIKIWENELNEKSSGLK